MLAMNQIQEAPHALAEVAAGFRAWMAKRG
jgi:hypothetical protein